MREHILHATSLSVVAFSFHFVWENIQCPLFFVHGTYEATWSAMTVATAGDVVITWILYGMIAATRRDWRWARQGWKMRDWTVIAVAALVIGFTIEWYSVQHGRWRYRPGTPLVPGTAVSAIPLLQLLILTPLAIRLSETALRFARTRRSRDQSDSRKGRAIGR